MTHICETTLEIDLKALTHNYTYLRSKINSSTKFVGVVKAYAYGSEAVHIANKLVRLGTDFLAVAYLSEGLLLREAGIEIPILVFHPLPGHFKQIVQYRLTPALFSRKTLTEFVATAELLQQKDFPVHLILNTGLNRLGFAENDISFILATTQSTSAIKIEGIYSHLAASEDPKERKFTERQIQTFKNISDSLIPSLKYPVIRHLCNTSGIFNYPEAHFDMVRSGIGLHGYGNAPEYNKFLKPVASLKTLISQIHYLSKGDSVSYNRMFVADHKMKIGTLPIGYADGLHRDYGNGRAKVLVKGQLAPIVGYICMDMIMIDLTGIDCKEGEEVLLFGQSRDANDLAQSLQTIPYEVITTISKRVKRIISA